MEKIRVFVTDASEVWRKILINHINAAPDMEAVGEINSSQGAIIMLDEVDPDVVMLEVGIHDRMPVEDAVTQLKAVKQDIVIVLCLDQSNRNSVTPMIDKGAFDFIIKPYKRNNVHRVIRESVDKAR